MSSQSLHLDPETLAAFAEGRLDAAKRDAVVAHIDHCDDCMNDVALVMPNAAAESERRRFGRPAWLLALAAALVLAIALPVLWRGMRHDSPTDQLVSLSPRSARVVEPRLTGGFPWAAYHGPMRAAGGSVTDAERLKLGGAAGELMQRAEHDRSAEAQHAAGVAMILVEKPDEAIAKLESAAKASHDAKSWSDLAAARYAAAVQFRRPSLYPEALAASDNALRIDARLPEALFNRALILENMGLISEARKAWQRYLEVDPGSQWANEARTHLSELPNTTGASRWERDQPLLEAAAASGDARKTLTLVDAHRERARLTAEVEYLGRWAEAEQRNDPREAARWLAIARSIGNVLAQLSAELMLHDAVYAIDQADAATRATIAEAHATYRRGRIAYSRHQLEPAERDLRTAVTLFQSVSDPMSMMARHYAAGAQLARNDIAGARHELQRLRADADANPAYLALGAHVRWELARACLADDDLTAEVEALRTASELARRGGERATEGFLESMLAAALMHLGRPDEAWSARILAFQAMGSEQQYDLLELSIAGAARAELTTGRRDSTLALLNVEQAIQPAGTDSLLAIDTLVRKAMLQSVLGNDAESERATQQADAVASRLTDPAVRAWQVADIDVTRGARLLKSDPRHASKLLTRAIDFYRSCGRTDGLPEPLLLRARCSLNTGQPAAAIRDLEEGVQAVEHFPVHIEGVVVGTGVLDAGNALFAEAIALHLNRGDIAAAFAYAERARGARGTIAGVQRRLATGNAVVIEIVALPEEVVTFAVSRDDAQVIRRQLPIDGLASLAELSAAGDERAAATLYDMVIRPLDALIARGGTVIIVPDPRLAAVPFAALLDSDSKRYLIEKVAVAIASDAGSLRDAIAAAPMHFLAEIELPSGAISGSAELPDAEKEMADVGAAYPHSVLVPTSHATWPALRAAAASADVIHIAGHTERQPGGLDQALLFAGRGSELERVPWKTIVAAPFRHARVIVAAACETLHLANSQQNRALSLGAAFAAGGADVVGTLRPIPDRDARELFRSVHRQLAAGISAVDSVRTAQLEAIPNQSEGGGTRAWRSIAVLTTRIPR
ncbi:MAG TPA: CHAT domain-containing protein [Thermoanaerobaculia bacterium]|jgi:tetratricopeptide (TPR) repeat protein|nr:CHAT domain-containing protein [Thermoanaerobaculia bacterium]